MNKLSFNIITKFSLASSLLLIVLVLISCGPTPEAVVNMKDMDGNPVGKVVLTENNDGVSFFISLKNLPPGIHAFHVHENGSFELPDFKKAGGHFNPFNREHGLNNPKGAHAGDLPNIWVKEDGTCEDLIITDAVTFEEGKKNSLLKEGGTSIIIHMGADDHVTDPAGDAGKRIAGGIIKSL